MFNRALPTPMHTTLTPESQCAWTPQLLIECMFFSPIDFLEAKVSVVFNISITNIITSVLLTTLQTPVLGTGSTKLILR
jgi:hypothetical protein